MEVWRILSVHIVLDSLQIFSCTIWSWIWFTRISNFLRLICVIQIWQYCSSMIWTHYVVRSDRIIPLDCRVQAKIQVTFTIIRSPPARSFFWCSHRWYRDMEIAFFPFTSPITIFFCISNEYSRHHTIHHQNCSSWTLIFIPRPHDRETVISGMWIASCCNTWNFSLYLNVCDTRHALKNPATVRVVRRTHSLHVACCRVHSVSPCR